jgi:hypothetical protein
LIALVLAACSGLTPDAPQTLAGVPGLRPVVQRYYEARATEENGRCRSPLLDGVLSATVLEEDAQRVVVAAARRRSWWEWRAARCSPTTPTRW